MMGIHTSSTQVRENPNQNILKHSNAKATTFMFNMLYIMHDFPLFLYFSLTFSCSAFSISKNIYVFFFLIAYSSFNELYLNSISFYLLLCALGPFPAVMLFLYGWPVITFSSAQEIHSKG